MLGWILKILTPIFVKELMEELKALIDKLWAERAAKKRIKEKLDDILKDPDPVSRAKRLSDLLNP